MSWAACPFWKPCDATTTDPSGLWLLGALMLLWLVIFRWIGLGRGPKGGSDE